jgi:hypothetical protein
LTSINEENKIAFIACIEVVLMRRGGDKHNSVLAKLRAKYDCRIDECMNHPEYLKTILKEVYKYDYDSVLDQISIETEILVDMDKFKDDFFKFMGS